MQLEKNRLRREQARVLDVREDMRWVNDAWRGKRVNGGIAGLFFLDSPNQRTLFQSVT